MRARNIKNDPKVNDDPGDGVVKQYKEQAEKLHQEYKEKIAKMEEAHADEVLQLKEELKKMQVGCCRSMCGVQCYILCCNQCESGGEV